MRESLFSIISIGGDDCFVMHRGLACWRGVDRDGRGVEAQGPRRDTLCYNIPGPYRECLLVAPRKRAAHKEKTRLLKAARLNFYKVFSGFGNKWLVAAARLRNVPPRKSGSPNLSRGSLLLRSLLLSVDTLSALTIRLLPLLGAASLFSVTELCLVLWRSSER